MSLPDWDDHAPVRRPRAPTGATIATFADAAAWLQSTLDRVQDSAHPDGWINVFEPEIIEALEDVIVLLKEAAGQERP